MCKNDICSGCKEFLEGQWATYKKLFTRDIDGEPDMEFEDFKMAMYIARQDNLYQIIVREIMDSNPYTEENSMLVIRLALHLARKNFNCHHSKDPNA